MAKNVKNKYPADKTGSKYSEFRNTKRVAASKASSEKDTKQQPATPEQARDKNA